MELQAYVYGVARKIKRQCSFCGKSDHEVRKLIAGPGVFICDQCVELASQILHEEGPPAPESPVRRPTSRRQSRPNWFRNLFKVRAYTT
ncbi:MAG: hypothetical protein NVS9B11_12260 [Candidatus Dormibacteraceae bacterium]